MFLCLLYGFIVLEKYTLCQENNLSHNSVSFQLLESFFRFLIRKSLRGIIIQGEHNKLNRLETSIDIYSSLEKKLQNIYLHVRDFKKPDRILFTLIFVVIKKIIFCMF